MDRVAIIRFLLAILYWCKGNPPTDEELSQIKAFPEDWFTKLDENKECFNLLGEGKRFYQDPKAHRERPTTDLIHEIPTANNFWHFRHSTDFINGLCPSCCAFGLLRLPIFCLYSLGGLDYGINGPPPIYVIPISKSLFDTLLFNWLKSEQLGTPSWVEPDIRPTPNENVPMLTGLTVLSRRVWLHDPIKQTGICINCGSNCESVILTCEYQGSGKLQNNNWNDPHVIYSTDQPRKSRKASDLTEPTKFRMDRPWPDLISNLIELGKISAGGSPISLFVVGFATNNAKYVDVWERVISVSPADFSKEKIIPIIRQWQQEGNLLDKRIPNADMVRRSAILAIRPEVEEKVSSKIGELLTGNDTIWEDAALEYLPMMKVISKSLSPGFTTEAVQRRKQIENTIPDMRLKTETDKKERR